MKQTFIENLPYARHCPKHQRDTVAGLKEFPTQGEADMTRDKLAPF